MSKEGRKRGAKLETSHAEPFAEALVIDPSFRSWVLGQTIFAEYADEARILNDEMLKNRSRTARNWWQSHYTEKCRCFGCGGKETDLLAIFETKSLNRFALHVEVKHPNDRFTNQDQAPAYPKRAACWARESPPKVLDHTESTTVLLFSDKKRQEYERHLGHFQTRITLESVKNTFPNASATAFVEMDAV